MDQDIKRARIQTLEAYLNDELKYQTHGTGEDSNIWSLFLTWYAEPYMQGSRTRTVALAKRMLAELKGK